MKSFLLKEKKPIIKWGMLPDNIYFEGEIPAGFQLAVSPSDKYIVIDVDNHGDIDGFSNIPMLVQAELNTSLNYATKNNGRHYWFVYTGNKPLGNKTSGLGIDLRTKKGYCVFYLPGDIRDYIHLIKETSLELNIWLESLFSYK
jgi:hypothetical protein